MTFYWWSHWFWITFLNIAFLPLMVVVHTYPSQETTSSNYNQNNKPLNKASITKLYQATTAVAWDTKTFNSSANYVDVAAETTVLHTINVFNSSSSKEREISNFKINSKEEQNNSDIEEQYNDTEDNNGDYGEGAQTQTQSKIENNTDNTDNADNADQNEVKRSVENYNKTVIVENENLGNIMNISSETVAEKNNYTNFSNNATNNKFLSTNSINSTKNISSNSITLISSTNDVNVNDSQPFNDVVNATATILTNQMSRKAANNDNNSEQTIKSTIEWLNVMAAHLPASHSVTTTDANNDHGTHKMPFTLENVNKQDELRRVDTEHRSRKSKGLSAEYKHIQRFINYSSDSKNLLTRSASTTPNDYDMNDEGNVSSEALSVQRTYFMDIGAISAICFTVFGICCTVATISIVLYRRRFLNKPQALSEPDSSVYIDDSTMRVSDNSDEMYSLDNDSFLNSLEAMTIQNYWTDTVKHTKL
uniref:Uncharacterized protein n=1 Tax=Glossina brevipalpis TaxID=37001 RepID=A0A1A9W8I3_9MUSC